MRVRILVLGWGAIAALGCSVESGRRNDAGNAGAGGSAGSGGGDAGLWCADDSAEPNQDQASAAVVPFAFHGTLSSATDIDVFRFSANRADTAARLIVASALTSDGVALELAIEVACEPAQAGGALVCRQGEQTSGEGGVICTSQTSAATGISAEASADCDAANAFITVRPTTAGVSACTPYTLAATSYEISADP